MRKSIASSNVFQVDSTPKNNGNELLVLKSSIEWSKLLLPMVDYVLANGYLEFRHAEKIYSSQFYVYYNQSEIKAYDWINNCMPLQLSPAASTSSSVSSNLISPVPQTNYLVSTYPRARFPRKKSDNTMQLTTNKNQKRRYSDESNVSLRQPHDDQENLADEIENTSLIVGQAKLNFEASSDKLKSGKQFKRQLGSTSKLVDTRELDDKLTQFLDLLNTEKENNYKFESRLSKISAGQMVPIDAASEKSLATNVVNDETGKDLDAFLEQFNQEKLKNEEFNLKLNQMLNYTQL